MKFSLILPTLGRKEEVIIFLDSLTQQEYKNFEVIVVDQNTPSIYESIILKYLDELNLTYIHSKTSGLSINRNIGISIAKGDILAFPDDDCEYNSTILREVYNFFNNNIGSDICSLNIKDKINGKRIVKLPKKDMEISWNNFYSTVCSATLFIRKKENIKYEFDNNLGIGTNFGSGEETDFILSLLHQGVRGKYISDQYVYHPFKDSILNKYRAFNYGMGFGAMCKKEIVVRNNIKIILFFVVSVLKTLVAIALKKNKEFYLFSLKGKVLGFIKFPIESRYYENSN